ncbi:MAG TPA: Rieske (2Fe-2S) protein [Gemmatimonadaceae bacterium]|jgi:3-phenylpropionate/trans-cinnamate dioxygenase ferredoxin subunit|nr:Rieske (2Fe-2S) protein [Gemmatimonadaceae bacterium]
MQTFERVTDDTIGPGELRAARLADGTPVCVGNADGQLFAVRDECPHSAFPLSNGTLLPGARLECGWHGAQFDCRTGAVLEGPADEPLIRYDVRSDGGGIFVSAAATDA